jgi:hypothetical protein
LGCLGVYWAYCIASSPTLDLPAAVIGFVPARYNDRLRRAKMTRREQTKKIYRRVFAAVKRDRLPAAAR